MGYRLVLTAGVWLGTVACAAADDDAFAWQPTAGDTWSVRGDFLYWYPRREAVPPLLTTSPAAAAGVIGQPGTAILYGDEKLQTRHHRLIGGRLTLDWEFDPLGGWGVEGRAFFLERDSTNYTVKNRNDLLLARPFLDAITGQPAAEVIAGPTPDGRTLLGGFNAYSRIETFGQELSATRDLGSFGRVRFSGLVGARFLQMRDRLDLTASNRVEPDRSILHGIEDHFQTFNKFFGGQVGLRGGTIYGPVIFGIRACMALGGTDQEIRTRGERSTRTPAGQVTLEQGLYVQPSNRGTFRRAVFDMASEMEFDLGLALTDNFRVSLGYSFLYWLNPVRSGNQIDAINVSQIFPPATGPLRPQMPFRDDFFWLSGFTLGATFDW
jgi:hypothetical protein